PGVAQRNWFRWKEDEANPRSAKQLGDGMLPCPDATLEPERDAVVLPWAATTTGTNGLLLLPMYTPRLGQASVEQQFDTKSPVPRLVLQTFAARSVTLVVTHSEKRGSETVEVSSAAETARISPRVSVFVSATEAQDLDFQRSLLPAYYQHLGALYTRPLILKPSVRLSGLEVTDFSQLVPVWLEAEGAFFYVNKIDQWESGDASTPVDLLRLTY
ncbi:hypothetical protein, partial [Hymenobacter sediminis]|uniref:hypothetical protein n=1 Tax=Hymenobacter sediminis TaxID=2218621 RepID=UPI00139039F7